MALMQITFTDKTNMDTKPDIPSTQKVTDDDMNEIKRVVNNNSLEAENSILLASVLESQSLNVGTQKLKIDTSEIVGNYFEFDNENNQIKVLKDCIALLSGSVFVDGSNGDGYVWAHIRVNSKNITSNLTRVINRDYTQCSIPTIATQLKTNDVIDCYVDYSIAGGTPKIRVSNDNTFLSVVKI